ncbi:probable calcium-binding protein CML25/26 [Glycine soja]|uniref:probable calcium-binding protein CML25/26 n=1 Tax=Glycine soja TaxID=3848 RepID=UPI00103CD775|nr:probable calcium-binding protein CML25/26 [Glycine soja]
MRMNTEFERVLKYFDEDGDGKISPCELRNRLGMIGGELLAKDAEKLIEELDSDGDGFLSLEDFVKLMEAAGEDEKLKDLEEAFEMYNDTEMFGFITPKSLQRMLGRLGESKSMEQCTTMIGHFDLNGDGLLCFDEFRFERVLKYFDEDGDGKISPCELRNRLGMIGGELLSKDAEKLIEELDSDGDGFLSLEDFVKLMEAAGEDEKLKDLEEAFEMYNDTEMFGFITPKSLQRMLGRLGESKSMEQCTTMIGHFDLNGDGLLCFDEFRVMMQ